MLILDNYDSFVHNLARYFRLLGCKTEVVRSDALSLEALRANPPEALVISPGPRGPHEAGISLEAVQQLSGRVPILGVCLGHQTIGAAFGADVVAGEPVHGRHSLITHDRGGLFHDLPSPISVARYHSLVIDPATIPDCLIADAHTADGTVMSIRHRQHPTFGVQFHPESVLTGQGAQLLTNFVRIAGLSTAVVEP